jgi:ADP-heptose:LPS heptosyltransferase
MRSVGLKELVVALRGRGVRLVNLQYGEVREEIEGVYEALGERVWECGEVDNREDLDGLAALIEACDEVVSIGNATAHLAGALGKRTTVLLPEAPSWRWLAQDDQTLWYSSVQVIIGAVGSKGLNFPTKEEV